jgi:hypothetical protein
MLGSIRLQICSNSPLQADPCVAPAGFDISTATLASQTGQTGFTIYAPGTNANTIVLSRVPVLAAAGAVSYTFTGVTNPSGASGLSYYGRIQTFASNDASGADTEFNGLAFSMNNPIQITTEVPPYLLFCGGVAIGGFSCTNASGDYINFGNLRNVSTATATSQLLAATNAGNGYTISAYGLTMTSGNNSINAMSVRDVSRPGTMQFGINLVANTTPAVGTDPQGSGSAAPTANYGLADWFKFASGDAIASASAVQDFRKFTISYIINIPSGQPAGVYTTTLTYVCLANF